MGKELNQIILIDEISKISIKRKLIKSSSELLFILPLQLYSGENLRLRIKPDKEDFILHDNGITVQHFNGYGFNFRKENSYNKKMFDIVLNRNDKAFYDLQTQSIYSKCPENFNSRYVLNFANKIITLHYLPHFKQRPLKLEF